MSTQRFNMSEFTGHSDIADKRFDAMAALVNPQPSGPWIVGGAVRRLLIGHDQDSDLDLSFASVAQLNETKARLQSKGLSVFTETENHIELRGQLEGKTLRVQLLRVTFAETPEAILDTFDFTLTQFAFDGTELVCGAYSLWDLARRRIVLHRLTFGAATVRRLLKYSKQGFTFCQGTIVSILESVAKDPATIHAETTYVD